MNKELANLKEWIEEEIQQCKEDMRDRAKYGLSTPGYNQELGRLNCLVDIKIMIGNK